jgi:hypothetical protein
MIRLKKVTLVLAVVAAALSALPTFANIIDGTDERGPLVELAASLGLSAAEVDRIRKVSGHVVCFEPEPTFGSGALFLTDDLVLSAGHIFFQASGAPASKCFFRPQVPNSVPVPLLTDAANARFGANPPKPGSNNDWAIVRLASPGAAEPFPPAATAPKAGTPLVVLSAHPVGFDAQDPDIPVAQPCSIRRAPVSSSSTTFYRSDCDASGSSSGGMHLSRENGALVFRGMTISSGPSSDPKLRGAPYNEKGGSVTTALGVDAAIGKAARELAGQ